MPSAASAWTPQKAAYPESSSSKRPDIAKGYGETDIVTGLDLRVMRGDRLGIVGPNGAGKTTLIKLLTGEITPDRGTIRHGANLEIVALDQKRDELNPNWTVADALTGGRGDQVVINGKARHVASYMQDFLFLPEQRLSPIRVLSGGERARLMLARALAKPSNVLVLDEPTNDLDLETLDLLQELLSDYAGTLLLVSHDRDFLDRIVTSVLAADGEWSLDRIRRRLFRYARPAQRRWTSERPKTPRDFNARKSAADGVEIASAICKTETVFQRQTCAFDASRAKSPNSKPKSRRLARSSPTRDCSRATALPSTRQARGYAGSPKPTRNRRDAMAGT